MSAIPVLYWRERMARLARLLPFMMTTEPTSTDLDWTRLQGTTLEGGYQLESILAADGGQASFKVRVWGDSAANAIAKLFAMEPAAAEEQAALWQDVRRLKDANLSLPLGAGHTVIDGSALAYVVLRRPDEKLDEILRERPLEPQEAGECLAATIAALEELHAHGLIHGYLAPEHILSLGESIKLSTECARRAGTTPPLRLARPRYLASESAHENMTPEEDIWCLGATLVEMLTQQACREDCLAQAEKLPSSFNTIARQCLDSDPAARPKLGQIEALFRGRTSPPQPQPPLPQKPQAAAAAAAGVGSSVPFPVGASASATSRATRRAALAPRSSAPASTITDVEEPKRRPLWPYVAAGVVFAVLLIWWLWPKHRASEPIRPVTAQSIAPAQHGTAWESRTLPPETAKPAPAAPPPVAQTLSDSKATAFVNGPVWRVVLYAYTREADAASKARSVNAKHPGLEAAAFSPTGGSPYLVVVGGRLTREDATRLLQKVRGLNLPRDAYIQNYSQ